jgi:hypothetical protein
LVGIVGLVDALELVGTVGRVGRVDLVDIRGLEGRLFSVSGACLLSLAFMCRLPVSAINMIV